MRFRKAKKSDIKRIQELASLGLELSAERINELYSEEKLVVLLKKKLSFVLVEKKEIMGFIGGSPDKENNIVVWVDLLVIEPKFQRKGVGTKIMNFFENELKERGFGQIVLFTETLNTEALQFYKKIGYLEVGRMDFLPPLIRIFFKKVINPEIVAKEIEKFEGAVV